MSHQPRPSPAGIAFLGAGGHILKKELASGEELNIDTNGLLAWEESVKMDIRMNKGCYNCCMGGEGLFNTVMVGPGNVYLQTMGVAKFQQLMREYVISKSTFSGVGGPASHEVMDR